ncbi:hypothetical protein ACWGJ2_18770 [Streptomyces sp. NPDC054796]
MRLSKTAAAGIAAALTGSLALGAGTAAAFDHGPRHEGAPPAPGSSSALIPQVEALKNIGGLLTPVSNLVDGVLQAKNGKLPQNEAKEHSAEVGKAISTLKKAAAAKQATGSHRAQAPSDMTLKAAEDLRTRVDALLKASAAGDRQRTSGAVKATLTGAVNVMAGGLSDGRLPAADLKGLPKLSGTQQGPGAATAPRALEAPTPSGLRGAGELARQSELVGDTGNVIVPVGRVLNTVLKDPKAKHNEADLQRMGKAVKDGLAELQRTRSQRPDPQQPRDENPQKETPPQPGQQDQQEKPQQDQPQPGQQEKPQEKPQQQKPQEQKPQEKPRPEQKQPEQPEQPEQQQNAQEPRQEAPKPEQKPEQRPEQQPERKQQAQPEREKEAPEHQPKQDQPKPQDTQQQQGPEQEQALPVRKSGTRAADRPSEGSRLTLKASTQLRSKVDGFLRAASSGDERKVTNEARTMLTSTVNVLASVALGGALPEPDLKGLPKAAPMPEAKGAKRAEAAEGDKAPKSPKAPILHMGHTPAF